MKKAPEQMELVPAPVEEETSSLARFGPELLEAAQEHVEGGTSERTKELYTRGWRRFLAWCETYGAPPCPARAEIVVLYITDLNRQGKRPATIDLELVAINKAHELQGYVSPTKDPLVREARKGIRRKRGIAPNQKSPISVDELREMTKSLDPKNPKKAARDRALLVACFAGAFRRSELVSLRVEHLKLEPEGLRIWVPKSKTDQEQEGREVCLPYGSHLETCPVRALTSWLELGDVKSGPVFRRVKQSGEVGRASLSTRSVAKLVKAAAESIGLDPSRYAGHSLRAGFATEAAKAGVPDREIAKQTGHKSLAVLQGYIREGRRWENNAAAKLDL